MLISKNKFFKGLALVLAVMMILPAVLACTDEAAQQSISEIKDSMLSEQDVKDIVAEVLAANPGVSADDIKDIVKDATKDLASAADVDKAVDSAVKDAVKDLPSKNDVDAAIKDAVGKIEEGNKTEAEAEAALVAKITAAKAQIEVIKDTYASNKADFSDEDYAKIIVLLSTASSDVANAKTVAEVDAIVAKLNEELAKFSSYALTILTNALVIEEKITKLLENKSAEIEADIKALKELVKEAVAHYYAANNGTQYSELKAYVIGKDANGTDITFNVLQFVAATTGANGSVSFTDTNADTITYNKKNYTPVVAAYNARVALIKTIEKDAKAVVDTIKKIGTVNLTTDSQDKVNAAKTLYNTYYQTYVFQGFDEAYIVAKITNKADLDAADARTIALNKAKGALPYISVDGVVIGDAYKAFQAKGLFTNWKGTFSDEELASAKALFDAIQAWAETAEWAMWVQPELKKSKDFSTIDCYFANFEETYWAYQTLVRTNAAYAKIKAHVQNIASINAKIDDDVTLLDAAARTEINNLCKNIINDQKVKSFKYNSGKKYYEENSAASMGVSNTVKMINAAATQLDVEIATQYVNAKATINGITYTGYSTSGSAAGRYLVGFNQTITEFMYDKYAVASTKIGKFDEAIDAIKVETAVSAEEARAIADDMAEWLKTTKETTGFDYSGDVAAMSETLNTKIDGINARINAIKAIADSLKTLVDAINKDQDNTEKARINTLDKPQIDAAYAKYVEFVQAGGTFTMAAETAKTSGGTTTYTYNAILTADLTKLNSSKVALDKILAKAEAVVLAIAELAKLPDGFTYLNYFLDEEDDGFWLGEWKEKTVNSVTTKYWARTETDIMEATEAVLDAVAAFKAANHNKKYAALEEIYAADAYKAFAFNAVKYVAIAVVMNNDGDAGSAYAQGTIEAIKYAADQTAIETALKAYNDHTKSSVALTVKMADFGL